MKKFFYSLLFMAVAMMSAMSFVACGSDDDMDSPSKEAYLKYVAWVSNDVLELADVVTEGVNFSFTSPATYGGISGKEGTVELSGKAASDANFTISFKLKSNWKEILATKDVVVIAYTSAQGDAKGSTVALGTGVHDMQFNRKSTGDDLETKVSGSIGTIKFRSK